MVRTGSRSSSRNNVVAGNRLSALVAKLVAYKGTKGWVVSCYLKLEPRDRQRGKYVLKLKNRIRTAFDAFTAQNPGRDALQQIEKDCAKVQQYLSAPGNLPAGRGIAIFVNSASRLFEVAPLAQVFRSRLVIDRTPAVRELQAVRDEFGRVLCAVVDRVGARLFEVSAAGALELPRIESGERGSAQFHGGRVRRSKGVRGATVGSSGIGEHNFQRRIFEERHRHLAVVADRLFTLTREQSVVGIVLGGSAKDTAAFEPHLHPYVRKHLIGTIRLTPQAADPNAVIEAVLGVRRDQERAWERRHVAELRECVPTGWGTDGRLATAEALARGQVRTLLVDADARDPEVDEAIEEALRQGVHVDIVEDPESRAAFDGIAGLLRFPRRRA